MNWGAGTITPALAAVRVLNIPSAIKLASNKLHTFNTLLQVNNLVDTNGGVKIPIPEFTTDRAVAATWLPDCKVVCRTKLTGHSGEGIVIAETVDQLPAVCPLFVKYLKKKKEYRVHVAFGSVIDVQEKRRRTDYAEEPNFAVRNFHTGWVYCRENVVEPAGLRDASIATVAALGLDFGAVDVIWNERHNLCTVLEVNTAPGLEGTTVESYADAFATYLRENNLAT